MADKQAQEQQKFIIWERAANLHYTDIAAEAVQDMHKKHHRLAWPLLRGFFENGKIFFTWHEGEFLEIGKQIIQDFLDPEKYKQKIATWEALTSQLREKLDELLQLELDELDNKELVEKYEQFNEVYQDWWGFAQVSEAVALASEAMLSEKYEMPDEDFEQVVALTSETPHGVEQKELMQAIAQIPEELSQQTRDEFLNTIQQDKKLLALFENHAKKYWWLRNSFAQAQVLTSEYFVNEAYEFLQTKKDARQELEKEEQRRQQRVEQKQEAISSYAIREEDQRITELLDEMIVFQDFRKAVTQEADWVIEKFCQELSRRTGIDTELLRWLRALEYEDCLNGKVSVEQLKQRQQLCFMVYALGKTELFTGAEAEQRKQKLLAEVYPHEKEEISGRTAYPGKVKGMARVILHQKDFSRMQQGDILVTTMTSPEFVPLMKKAAAIVTDEGGVTCHAAVVSRELGIPCIIGTKIATRTIPDGASITVDAEKGNVHIY